MAGLFFLSSGCATLVHGTAHSPQRFRSTAACSESSDVCPWMIADVGLLFLGVIPGVVALGVDFATGAWHHPSHDGVGGDQAELASTQ